MESHRAVLWSLRAGICTASLARCGQFSADSFRWHWTAGPRGAYGVSVVRYGISSLIDEIELWLRARIQAELRKVHGASWWAAIPKEIRQRAESRYRLACAEFGTKRIGAPHSASWFSFGDILKLIDQLDRDSWIRSLDATSHNRLRFSRAIRKVKAFRDARIAHLQSGGPTATDVAKVLAHIDKLCELLRPQDYILCMAARKVLLSDHVGRHRKLLFDLYEPSSGRRPSRTARLRALDRAIPPSLDGVRRDLDLAYYDALLACCAEAGGTISPFVADG